MSKDGKKTITIDVKDRSPSVDPIVVSFPSGVPQQEPKPKFVWRKLRTKAKRGRTVVGQDDTCRYQARSDGRGYDGRRTKLCVGLYHKPTGKLTLHQAAEGGNVFCLQQAVPGYESTEAAMPSQMSPADRRRALFESFGSSKKQKVLKSQEGNVVNVDSVVGAGDVMMGAFWKGQNLSESNRKAIEDAKSGTKLDAVELAYAEARRNFLPSFDQDAQEPHLVYDARDMAGDDAWGQVSRVTDACLHRGDNEDFLAALTSRGQWHDSVRLALCGMARDAPSAKYQIKCAILLNHMVSFHRQRRSRNFLRGPIEELANLFKMPLEIATKFLELFSTSMSDDRGQEGFAFSKQSTDKCLVHILLLYLMVHGRQMKAGNIKPIADDVRIELGEAAKLLRAAGCTVKSIGGSTMSAALIVPLKFPAPKRGRGRA